jgi:hypothetical protein
MMASTKKKWIKELTREALNRHIIIKKILTTKNNHLKVFIKCNNGTERFVIVSGTPSDFRVTKKIIRDLRREQNNI